MKLPRLGDIQKRLILLEVASADFVPTTMSFEFDSLVDSPDLVAKARTRLRDGRLGQCPPQDGPLDAAVASLRAIGGANRLRILAETVGGGLHPHPRSVTEPDPAWR